MGEPPSPQAGPPNSQPSIGSTAATAPGASSRWTFHQPLVSVMK